MPKQRTTFTQRKDQWIREFELESYVKLDGAQFICQACNKGYGFTQKSQLEQHKKTLLHIEAVHRFNTAKEKQPLIRDAFDTSNTFYMDMCEAFVAADIPFSKLDNPTFFNFLEKYTKQHVPSRVTLSNYLPKVHAKVLNNIRDEIGSKPFWVEVDETTDKTGRFIANVIVGPLCKDTASRGHLVVSKPIVKTNNSTIIQSVLDSFQVLWPGMPQEEIDQRFRLLLTDGVNYMLTAGRVLKCTYPSLIHVTCLSHGLNLVAETVRAKFPNVDRMLAAVKKVFKKAPNRILTFKEMNPDMTLPPEAVVSRWGSWLKVAEYYANNFAAVKAVIDTLDPADAVCIETAQQLMDTSSIIVELTHLSANFTFLCTPISILEQQGATISSTLETIADVRRKLLSVKEIIGKKILDRFDLVMEKNSGLRKMKTVSKVINGDPLTPTESIEVDDLSPAEIAAFKFAPLTTVDVERSFSIHKAILTDRRHSMTVENLEMEVVAHSYYVT